MAVEQIYVTDFILPDLHVAMSDYTESSIKSYQPLVNSINAEKVQLRITEEFYSKIKLGWENEKNEFKKEAYGKLVAWIAASMIRPLTTDEFEAIDHSKNRIRKTTAVVFAPCTSHEISAALHDYQFDSTSKEELRTVGTLKKLLMKSERFAENKYEFLFKTQELPQLKVDEAKEWYRNISRYTIPTKVVRIIDKYFIKNNKDISISELIGNLIRNAPGGNLRVELITDINKAFKFEDEINRKMTLDWINEIGNESVKIDVYDIVKNPEEFHDRHLWTEYWNLQLPYGIKGKKTTITTPVLTGRYSEAPYSWNWINENWQNWINNDSFTKKVTDKNTG